VIDTIAMSRAYATRIRRLLAPALKISAPAQLDLLEPAPTWQAQLEPTLALLRGLISPDQALLEAWRAVRQVERVQLTVWRRIAASLDVEPTAPEDDLVMAQSVAAQARAILDLGPELADGVEGAVTQAWQRGLPTIELASTIRERTQVTQARATTIARSGLARLNGELAQERQLAAGVTRYRWSTSRDERVRSSHRALDGQIFEWAAPPPEGHPGHDWNCRCVAIPILDD
jgi:SPP1 gp7 family putative phage head morphogenesis protein